MHAIAVMGTRREDAACRFLDVALASLPLWIARTQDHAYLRDMPPHSARQLALWYLFKTPNKFGFTPLKIAGKYGIPDLLHKIVSIHDLYCFDYISLGVMSQRLYDATEFDPLLCRNDQVASVISFLMYGSKSLSQDWTQIPVVAKVLTRKWRFYRLVIIFFCLWHGTLMSLLSFGLISKSFAIDGCNADSFKNDTQVTKTLFGLQVSHLVLGMSCIYFLIGVCIVVNMVRVLRKAFPEPGTWLEAALLPVENLWFILFSVCNIVTYVLRTRLCSDLWVSTLSLGVVAGWLILLISFHITDTGALFIHVFYNSFNDNIFRCALLILYILIATTLGTMVYFSYSKEHNEIFSTDNPKEAVFSFFQLAIGITDVPSLHEHLSHSWLNLPTALYAFFLVVVNILILNLLIAMMTDSLSQISAHKSLVIRVKHLGDSLILESFVPEGIVRYLCPDLLNYVVRDISITLPDGRRVTNRVHLINAYCHGKENF